MISITLSATFMVVCSLTSVLDCQLENTEFPSPMCTELRPYVFPAKD